MTDWRARLQALTIDGRAVIDGQRVDALDGGVIDSISPADGSVVAAIAAGTALDVDRAVTAARAAQEAWAAQPLSARSRLLRAFADRLEAAAEELGLLDSLEMGMPILGAVSDIALSVSTLRWCADAASMQTGEFLDAGVGSLNANMRVPRGVVGAIVPWNFPTFNAISKLAPALAIGNAVVLKPSELSSLSALRIADLALDAGLPPGILHVVPGLGTQAGEALALHPDVDLLAFTGSPETGRRLMEASARSNLKPLALELGGKSPQVVFADARDLEAVADAVVATIFWNSGQVCTAGSRLLVEKQCAEELQELVVERAAEIRIGHPFDEETTHGPLASAGQRDRVAGLVALGLQEGAKVLLGGHESADPAGGFGYSPTVLATPAGSELDRREVFGPVLSVRTFADTDEAVALANDTDFGLSATVWTDDLRRGHDVARRLRCGSVSVNPDPEAGELLGATAEPARGSGFGPEGGKAGLDVYTRMRMVSLGL